MSKLYSSEFYSEDAAFKHFESIVWLNGPCCPHCGGLERLIRLKGKSARAGLWECCKCRKEFTAKVGTFFEYSHLPTTKWLQAIYLMTSSRTDIPAYRLYRILEVQYKTAWFIARHLREAMNELNRGQAKARPKLLRRVDKGVKTEDAQIVKFRAAIRELGHEGSDAAYDDLLRKVAQLKPVRRMRIRPAALKISE